MRFSKSALLCGTAALATIVAFPSTAHAQNLAPVHYGSFVNSGRNSGHSILDREYIAGYLRGFELEFRNVFVFDLTSVSSPITAATLKLYNPISGIDLANGYLGDATETYDLTSTSSSIADVLGNFADGSPTGIGVFNSLGTGTSFATVTASAASNGKTINLNFNAAGLATLNSAIGGQVAFGGRITTISGPTSQCLFGGTHYAVLSRTTTLVALSLSSSASAAAPEPTTFALLALGISGGLIARRRK
jgi:hypothetical protein